MSKYKSPEKTETFGEDFRRDTGAEREEGCNAFYNRKQRTKANDLAPDVDAEFAPPDRNAEEELYRPERDSSFLNYKKWDRYGGK